MTTLASGHAERPPAPSETDIEALKAPADSSLVEQQEDGDGDRLNVAYGTTILTAQLRRSPRRKTVALTIDPELGLIVTAPTSAPRERLEAMIRQKAKWIVGHLEALEELEAPMPPRQGLNGESLLYLGRHYRVFAQPAEGGTGSSAGAARLRGGRLVVPLGVGEGDPSASLREAVRVWLKTHAERRLPERVALWSRRLGVHPQAVLIREPARRWGSCNERGEVRLNWRIIQAPMALVDYVVAHELVHLVHKDHSAAFWGQLGAAMPDYEERREALRRLGPQLGW